MKKITVAILGCGNRGRAYTRQMLLHPDWYEVVALADNDPGQVELMHSRFGLEQARDFSDIDAFFAEKWADVVVIATPDRDHVPHATRAMELGYDVLLEKPLTDSREEVQQLLDTQKKTGRKVMVCHVLRYGPGYKKCDELLASGAIGRLYAIDASERVVYWHWAQAYVRGIAGTTEFAHPTILAKCCHDLDLIQHYAGSKCDTLSSVGGLDFFKKENAPEGATERCLDCPHNVTCPYSAKRIYFDKWLEEGKPAFRSPYFRAANVNPITEEALLDGLRNGPFGRCVFHCGATNSDHQMVQMTFENGVKASMKMVYAAERGRRITFYGTLGEIIMDERDGTVTLWPSDREKQVFEISAMKTGAGGHAGGDEGLIDTLYGMVTGTATQTTSLEESVESHLIGIAAEESRKQGGKLVKVHG